MKKIILLLIIFPLFLKAQLPKNFPIDSVTNKISFSKIIFLSGSKQDYLYQNAKEWFILNFNSGKDVIQLDSKETGKLIGKGFAEYPMLVGYDIRNFKLWFTVFISTKDGKYKYVFTDLQIENNKGVKTSAEDFFNRKDSERLSEHNLFISSKIRDLTSSLKNKMTATDDF